MIITISGAPGAGDTTAADMLGKELNYEVIKVGEIYKELAKDKDLEPDQLWEKQEKNPEKLEEFHKELDQKQKKLAKEKENVVINGKLSAYHVPNADLKILLTADLKERAKRILMRKKIGRKEYAEKVDEKKAREDEKKELNQEKLEKQMEKIRKREEKEKKHWGEIYGYKYLENREKYDQIIDTTQKRPSEVVQKIKERIKQVKNE